MGDVFLLAFLAALYPSLLAATTVMLMLPHPKRLLIGYLLGAAMTSITLGLVIVFTLRHAGLTKTTQTTLGPAEDIALGCLALAIAFVLHSGRDRALAERRRERKAAKGDEKQGPPRWQQALGRGSARTTFVVGALLTLPGATYITALYRISDENLADPVTVLARPRLQPDHADAARGPPARLHLRPGLDARRRSSASSTSCANAAASGVFAWRRSSAS